MNVFPPKPCLLNIPTPFILSSDSQTRKAQEDRFEKVLLTAYGKFCPEGEEVTFAKAFNGVAQGPLNVEGGVALALGQVAKSHWAWWQKTAVCQNA